MLIPQILMKFYFTCLFIFDNSKKRFYVIHCFWRLLYVFKIFSAQLQYFVIMQAIKNGIMAVCYSKDSNEMPGKMTNLKVLCSDIYDKHLDSLVEKVDSILINIDFLTQPNSSNTAFEKITDYMANIISELVDQILSRCDELVRFYYNY